jgi:hypothetical protein
MYNLEQERTSIFTTRVCDTPFLIAITIRKPKRSNTQPPFLIAITIRKPKRSNTQPPFLIAITIRKPKRSNTQHVSCTNQQVGSKRAANDKKDASNALEKYSSAD